MARTGCECATTITRRRKREQENTRAIDGAASPYRASSEPHTVGQAECPGWSRSVHPETRRSINRTNFDPAELETRGFLCGRSRIQADCDVADRFCFTNSPSTFLSAFERALSNTVRFPRHTVMGASVRAVFTQRLVRALCKV